MKKQILARILTCSALLTLSGTAVVPAIMNPTTVRADSTVSDNTSTRSLTITKYQATDINDHGEKSDGTATNPDKKVLQDVKFKIQRVKAVDGHQLVDAATAKEKVDYTIDDTFTAQETSTDKNGKITWDLGNIKAADGIYLVTEIDDSQAKDKDGNAIEVTTPAAPFFVQIPQTNRTTQSGLIYDVVVEPKNVIVNDLKPVKTVEDKLDNSIQAGLPFEWELTTALPSGLYSAAKADTEVSMIDKDGNQLYDASGTKIIKTFKAGEVIYIAPEAGVTYYDASGVAVDASKIVPVSNFTMTDNLDKDLKYLGATVWALPKGETTYVELPTTFYKLTAPTTGTSGTVKMELTEEGLKSISNYEKISTHINTKVDEGFNGLIANTFETTYQTPGGKPTKPVTPPVDPKTFTGGFDIKKIEKGNDTKVLSGAVFHIATSEENANAGKFLATDGKSYTIEEAATAGTTLFSSTTDASGHAAFDGLALTWTDTNTNGEVDATGDSIEQNYWVVETKAPEGYELLKSPQEIKVNLDTEKDNTIELTAEDEKKTDLPFTGGTGTALMIAIAVGAIAIGTATIIINKKRNGSEA